MKSLHKIYRFNPNLYAIHMQKKRVRIDKPTAPGFCVLELSKLHMYQFHYSTIRARFGDRAKLLLTDTDSLIYHLTTPDVYSDLFSIREQFDFANYKGTSPYYDTPTRRWWERSRMRLRWSPSPSSSDSSTRCTPTF
jgi:hypothetical protein